MNNRAAFHLFVVCAATSLLAVRMASAVDVTPEMSAKAVGNWRVCKVQLGMRLGRTVSEARQVEYGGARFNVVRMAGGGYVVTSSDTSLRPVIMFSDDDDFTVCEENPALSLLVGELTRPVPALATSGASGGAAANERAWAQLLADRPELVTASVSAVDDLRVPPIVRSKWGQSKVTVNGSKKNCYNYYTPSNYVCGCVATAAAQIMRRFEWPRADVSVAAFSNGYCEVDDKTVTLTAMGGCYDWSLMPYVPSSDGTTQENRRMIGKLTYDVGVGVAMSYASGGSGASTLSVKYALTTHFGYSYAAACSQSTQDASGEFGRVMRANFDAKLPVQLSIRKASGGGHSIVGDGYGYIDGTVYYHLNFGWNGSDNAWYAPPDIGGYDHFGGMVHNIYTNQNAKLVIASGRVTDETGQAAVGVTVHAEDANGTQVGEAVRTDSCGIYALYVNPGSYAVKASRDILSGDGRVIGVFAGETTANPVKCNSVKVYASGGYGSAVAAGGNDSGRDITVRRIDYLPSGTVELAKGVTLGADFASVTTEVSARVTRFGAESAATLNVVLAAGERELDRRKLSLTDLEPHTETIRFDGLVAGETYRLTAELESDGKSLAEDAVVFVAARHITAEAELPPVEPWPRRDPDATVLYPGCEKVLASETVTMDVQVGEYSQLHDLAVPSGMRIGIAAVHAMQDGGEFAIWDGAGWRRTGVAVARDEICRFEIFRRDDQAECTLIRNGMRESLGTVPWRRDPASSTVGLLGAGDLLSLKGEGNDANLVATADGTVEYADFAAAIAAGETRTLTPLWSATGTIPAGARLVVFSLLDPKGLLRLTGGELLKDAVAADGSRLLCYGTMDADRVANSDYLKATMVLGLGQPIDAESDVTLGEVGSAEGMLGFSVTVDGEQVTRERVTDYVRTADRLVEEAWRRPAAEEIGYDDGRVSVAPTGRVGRTFIRLEIPRD